MSDSQIPQFNCAIVKCLSAMLLVGMGLPVAGCGESAVDGVPTLPVIRIVLPNPDFFGLEYEDVRLQTANGETLAAWFIPARHARATILIHHGAIFTRSWPLPQIALFNKLGCNVMIADYQGFADSTGVATLSTMLDDANTSLAYVRQSAHEGTDRIVLFGVSMGTMIAMAQAADAPPEVVGMMIEGIVELDVLSDIGYGYMGIQPSPDASKRIPVELDPQLTAPRITINKLFLQSVDDLVTPFEGAQLLFDLSPEPKRFATLTGIHGLGIVMDPGFSDKLNSFLDEVAPFPAE